MLTQINHFDLFATFQYAQRVGRQQMLTQITHFDLFDTFQYAQRVGRQQMLTQITHFDVFATFQYAQRVGRQQMLTQITHFDLFATFQYAQRVGRQQMLTQITHFDLFDTFQYAQRVGRQWIKHDIIWHPWSKLDDVCQNCRTVSLTGQEKGYGWTLKKKRKACSWWHVYNYYFFSPNVQSIYGWCFKVNMNGAICSTCFYWKFLNHKENEWIELNVSDVSIHSVSS